LSGFDKAILYFSLIPLQPPAALLNKLNKTQIGLRFSNKTEEEGKNIFCQ